MKNFPFIYDQLEKHINIFENSCDIDYELVRYIYTILDNEITKYSTDKYCIVINNIDAFLSNLNLKDLKLYLNEFQEQENHLYDIVNGENI